MRLLNQHYTRRDLPLAARRLGRWWLFPMTVIAGGAVWFMVHGVFLMFAEPRPWMGFYITLAILCPLIISSAMVLCGKRRLKLAYHATEGRLCTNCVHDLRGLGDRGRCPECGRAFDTEQDRRAWRRAGIGAGAEA